MGPLVGSMNVQRAKEGHRQSANYAIRRSRDVEQRAFNRTFVGVGGVSLPKIGANQLSATLRITEELDGNHKPPPAGPPPSTYCDPDN